MCILWDPVKFKLETVINKLIYAVCEDSNESSSDLIMCYCKNRPAPRPPKNWPAWPFLKGIMTIFHKSQTLKEISHFQIFVWVNILMWPYFFGLWTQDNVFWYTDHPTQYVLGEILNFIQYDHSDHQTAQQRRGGWFSPPPDHTRKPYRRIW